MAKIFRPIRGNESDLFRMMENESVRQDGDIYFALDTGFIYIWKDGQRYTLGGSGTGGGSSFVWADAEEDISLFKDDEESNIDPYYHMSLTALEDSSKYPQPGIMVINSDGRFFRVLGVNATEGLIALQLIAAGGGSGGGTGGVTLTIAPDLTTFATGYTYVYGKEQYITITGTSKVPEDSFVSFEFEVTDLQHGAEPVYYTGDSPNGIPYNFNTAVLPESTELKIKVTVSSLNCGMRQRDLPFVEFIVKVVKMKLNKKSNKDFLPITTSSGNNLAITVIPYGEGLTAELHVSVNGNEINELKRNISGTFWGKDTTVNIPRQNHGVYPISLWLTSKTANGSTITSDPVNYQAAWADDEEDAPLIWLGDIPETVILYENAVIPFMIYDPRAQRANSPSIVNFYQEGGILDYTMNIAYRGSGWYTWDVSNLYKEGNNNFSIVLTSGSNMTPANISFVVTREGAKDLRLIDPDSLIMNFSSIGRSNEESAYRRTIWEDGLNNSVIFNNFNWYNNGWKNDNDGIGSYLCVANGASVEIPIGRNLSLNGSIDGYTIETRFRVRNIQSYSTLVTTDAHYFVAVDPSEIPTVNFVMNPNKPTDRLSVPMSDIKQGLYTPAVDKDGNWVMDEQNSPKLVKTADEDGVVFRYMDGEKGLCIGTQEAYFKTSSGTMNVRYKENEIITLTLVILNKLGYLYLNGMLSAALNLADAGDIQIQDLSFRINSKTCDFDLYKLRIYQKGLSMPQVIHNYIADVHDPALFDQNQLTRDDNPTLLSYHKLLNYNTQVLKENEIDKLTMPYAVFEIIDNVEGLLTPSKENKGVDDDLLPWKKGNSRYCKITFVNPTLDALYNAGKITDEVYERSSPSYVCIGAEINVQGTSSQTYPRRNFKTKHKSAVKQLDAEENTHEDWGWFYTNEKFIEAKGGKSSFKKWLQDNPSYGTDKYTWKIDYMESSGSYNTGFANLVGNNIYYGHPLDYYHITNLNTNGLRTSVYGFPVLTFHKHSKPADKLKDGTDREDEIYEYIGRYNLNQDKGSDELYGFSLDVEQPYVWEEKEVVNKETGQTEIVRYHPTIADVAECWELLDNQGTWTSFSYPTSAQETHFSTYQADSYDENDNLKPDAKLEVIRHFECRYHKYADFIEAIASDEKPYDLGTVSEKIINPKTKESDRAIWQSINTIPKMNNFIIQKWANWERFVNWCDSTDRTKADPTRDIEPIEYEVDVFPVDTTGVTNTRESEGVKYATFTKDTATYRLAKFKAEFNKHLNLEYCSVYYVLTELLLCYDSRGKNLMMASYGPMEVGGEYIWFPIFYDIDTQLGLNNIGATLWDYDTDATAEQAFSTPSSVLWINFLECFKAEIQNKYNTLRNSGVLSYNSINGAYLCDPSVFGSYAMRGLRPLIAIGLDSYYKYIAYASGYYNTSGAISTDAKMKYLYAINGDRILSRELLLRNRLNYLDSYWIAGNYTVAAIAQSGVGMRANANNVETSDKYLDSALLNSLPDNAWAGEELAPYPVQYFDSTPEFEITPFLSQYVFTYLDKQLSGAPVKYQGVPIKTTCSDSVTDGYRKSPGFPEQIITVPAEEYVSSLGDLSTKYLSQFNLSNAIRILDLRIGSDVPGYFNNKLGVELGQFNLNDSKYIVDANTGDKSLNTSCKTLLQKIILSNIPRLADSIDVSGSEKLTEFRALNTIISNVTFADGAPLDTVHLPKSVSQIQLVDSRNLTRILTTKPQAATLENGEVIFASAEDLKGLYIENVTDYNPNWNINESAYKSEVNYLSIDGGSLEYDSYKILDNLIKIKERMATPGRRLQIKLTNVHWSPYSLIDDEEYLPAVYNYYYLTDHNTFKKYIDASDGQYTSYNPEQWQIDFINERIFIKNDNSQEDINTIQDLSLIDTLIDDYDNVTTGLNHYTNTDGYEYPTRAALTGTIYVNNTPETAIDELAIGNRYKEAFPRLNIYAAYVAPSFTSKFVVRAENGKDTTIDTLRFDSSYEGHISDLTQELPKKNNYDFVGWSIDAEGETLVAKYENEQLTILPAMNDYTFSRADDRTFFTFYAQFTLTKFDVTFLNYDNSVIQTIQVEYSRTPGIQGPSILPYRAYEATDLSLHANGDLNLYHFWRFKEWINTANNKVVNLADIVPINNYTLKASYEDANVHEHASRLDESYFKIVETDDIKYLYLNTYTKLAGKVTIPATINGVHYDAIGSLRNPDTGNGNDDVDSNEITHIFFETDPQLQLVNFYVNCCRNMTHLVYVEIPANTGAIRDNAFTRCQALGATDNTTGTLSAMMFSNVYDIWQNAFNACGMKVLNLGIPSHKLRQNAFANMRVLTTIIMGNASTNSEQTVEDLQSGNNKVFGGPSGTTGTDTVPNPELGNTNSCTVYSPIADSIIPLLGLTNYFPNVHAELNKGG